MAQYTTDSNLAARIRLHEYSVNKTSWPQWYWTQVPAEEARTILDVGCGNGMLWEYGAERLRSDARVTLVDASPGMLEAARAKLGGTADGWEFVNARVEGLPFESDSFDLVLANHMLYHADDLPLAISELARVVTAEGVVVASTNGPGHMKQFGEWVRAAGVQEAVNSSSPGQAGSEILRNHIEAFGLNTAPAHLESSFDSVVLMRHEDWISATEVAPVIDYLRSLELPATKAVEKAIVRLQSLLERIREECGELRIDKESGLFLCTRPVGSV